MHRNERQNKPNNKIMEKDNEHIPKGATHTRDEDFYRVSHKVETFWWDIQQWKDCENAHDLEGWLSELEPIKKT